MMDRTFMIGLLLQNLWRRGAVALGGNILPLRRGVTSRNDDKSFHVSSHLNTVIR